MLGAPPLILKIVLATSDLLIYICNMQLVNIFIFNVLGVLLFLYIFAEIERNRYMYVLSDFFI